MRVVRIIASFIDSSFLQRWGRRTGARNARRRLMELKVNQALRCAGLTARRGIRMHGGAVSPSATSTGYASTFATAGFSEIARRSPERPIMRLELEGRR